MSQRHVLYHSYPFRSSRCAWVIAELGKESEFEVEKVSLHGNPAALEAYGEVHPFRTIPALRLPHGELLLESGAICMYVADLYQSEAAARSLLPREGEAGSYFNWIFLATSTGDQILEPLYMQLTHTPEERRDEALISKQRKRFTTFARTLNAHLEGKQWICGDHFTVADCVIGYNVWWASIIRKGELLVDYPAIIAYQERLTAREAFKSTFSRSSKA